MTSLRRSLRGFVFGTAIFLAGCFASLVWTGATSSSPDQSGSAGQTEVFAKPGEIHSSLADVAEMVRPAVVFIKTERSFTTSEQEENFGPFDFFKEMLPEDHPRRVPGGGSGFIIDTDGRILTNYHVIREAEKITVVLGYGPDEEEYDATVVGFDTYTDIAVIKIGAERALPVVKLGDSDEMRVGDWVMAVGTPFGQLAGTVTVGIISAKGRTNLLIMGGNDQGFQDFIQTDASINFGNSGGPLVNLRGEAIGIATAINPSGQGIGFAIPVNMAKNITRQLVEKGRVQYGFLGIRLQELNKALAQGLDLDVDSGILVTEVLPDTPAEKAGVQKNDVIVEFDKNPVRDDGRFRLMVANTEVGTAVPMVVVRDGKKKQLNITLTERPKDDVLAAAPQSQGHWLGLQVDEIENASEEGVVVVDVEDGSPAGRAGIRQGDVITEIYSRRVSGLKEYVEVSEKLKDRKEPIAFLVKREKTSRYIPVIPEKG
jgi:Do/DeqQ family serine protease